MIAFNLKLSNYVYLKVSIIIRKLVGSSQSLSGLSSGALNTLSSTTLTALSKFAIFRCDSDILVNF